MTRLALQVAQFLSPSISFALRLSRFRLPLCRQVVARFKSVIGIANVETTTATATTTGTTTMMAKAKQTEPKLKQKLCEPEKEEAR